MNLRNPLIALVLLLAWLPAYPQAIGIPDPGDIPLREPAEFPALPLDIRHDLERRGCRIPQSQQADPNARSNVVSGRFGSAAQRDWAVLCSRNGDSSLLVYWRGDINDVLVEAGSPDMDWMQWQGPPEGWQYTRYIATATPKMIRRLADAFGDPSELPVPLDHDGIEAGDSGKASTIRYWHHGQWIELTGMD
ncbi:hypothetical protein [Lysobacter solisilvae (ex Woo and Kim 2020)]|uniref:Uncharacterized protein n=1 Tax=Agrilutibacter terrestris TaxID=2865112 RepID=A0A7H0FVI5_9GAMM|nr:hypothetical protein [Lysobacter terrestris]QNP40051.1 hypothetical protein H8B22_11150 [Lysobacter terrestris]